MKILLVEDNPMDVRLMLHALRQQEDWLKGDSGHRGRGEGNSVLA